MIWDFGLVLSILFLHLDVMCAVCKVDDVVGFVGHVMSNVCMMVRMRLLELGGAI
jgi:hypothetical protein